MADFEEDLAAAGSALNGLVTGPGQAAADALGAAFDAAGARIEAALGQAARTGELDFSRMADAILGDLARIAAEALIAQTGLGQAAGAGQTVNFNINAGAGADAQSIMNSRGAIASTLARTVAAGGRFI